MTPQQASQLLEASASVPPRPGVAGRIMRALGLLLVFATALVGSVLLHVNTAPVRSVVADQVNALLGHALYGEIRIEGITNLSTSGVALSRATLSDEHGEDLIELRDLRVELDTLTLLRDVVFGGATLNVVLSHTRVERSFVRLRADQSGDLTLARAFTPRPRERRDAASSSAPPRYVRVWLPVVELGSVEGAFGLSGWEHVSALLSSVRGRILFSPKGILVDVDRFGANLNGVAGTSVRGTGSFNLRAPGPVGLEFTGFVDEAELQAEASIERGIVTLKATSPRLSPETVRALVPDWPLLEAVSLKLEGSGRLPKLDTTLDLSIDGGGVLSVEGPVDLSRGLSARLAAELEEFDLRSVLASGPETAIDASSQVVLELDAEGARLELTGTSSSTVISGLDVPKTDFSLKVNDDGVRGTLKLHEPHAPLELEGSFAGDKLAVEARSPRVALAKQRRLPRGLSGVSSLDAQLELEGERLALRARGVAHDFGVAGFSARQVDFSGLANAKLDTLADGTFELDLKLRDPKYGRLAFDRGTVRAKGTRKSVFVVAALSAADGRSIDATGTVFADLSVRRATLALARRSLQLRADIQHLDLRRSLVDVSRLHITGPEGELETQLLLRPGVVEADVEARNLNLERLSSELALGASPLRGVVNLEASASIGEDVQKARLRIGASRLSVQHWGRSDLTLTADLEGRTFTGTLHGKDALGFATEASWNTELAGHPLKRASWLHATGTAELGVTGIDLEPLALASSMVESVEGRAGVKALLQRTDPNGLPNAFVEVGVSLEQAEFALGDRVERLQEVELYSTGVFEASTHKLHGVTTIADRQGQLLSATAAFAVDPLAFLSDAARALTEFRRSPISVSINVPERRLSELPSLRPSGVDGVLSGQLAMYGSLDSPQVSVQGDLRGISAAGLDPRSLLALNLVGTYAPLDGALDVKLVGTGRGRSLLMGRAEGTLPYTSLADGEGAELRARLALDRFPLALLSPLSDQRIDGSVSGQLAVARGADSFLTADLDVDALTSGRAALGSGVLRMKGEAGRILLTLALKHEQRSLSLRVNAGAPTDQIPMPAQIDAVDVELVAQKLNAGALEPMLADLVSRLSGDLDAQLTLLLRHQTSVTPGAPHVWQSTLSGSAELGRASAYVEGLGLELTDMSVSARATGSGDRTSVSLEGLRARARSDHDNVEGQATIELENQRVLSGTAALRLRSVPITLQGLNLGKARGQVLAKFTRRPNWDVDDRLRGRDYLDFEIELHDWQMRATAAASRELIELAPPTDVIVLQRSQVAAPNPDAIPFRFTIDLGERASFRLADLEVPLSGTLRVDYADESRMHGTLRLQRGGRIPIFGQVFSVVDGELRLDPRQPSNPLLDINLVGRNADDQVVDLHIGGTLKEPRTDPDPGELQALLGGGAGAALSGGVQALGVSQLLGESVQLRVNAGQEQEEEASYTAAVQIDDELWFEANYQRSQDNTLNQEQSETLSGTLDYRFHKNWSLRTKMGNTGGSLDLLWQYRY